MSLCILFYFVARILISEFWGLFGGRGAGGWVFFSLTCVWPPTDFSECQGLQTKKVSPPLI